MRAWDELAAGEVLVQASDELLWRQVHPDWVTDDGVPTSQAFKPAQADVNKPSVARSQRQTAEDAYRWHTESAQLKSRGTWGVTAGECTAASLRVIDDSNAENAPAHRSPAHAYLDFRPHSKSERKIASASLLSSALRRGQVYPPTGPGGDRQ